MKTKQLRTRHLYVEFTRLYEKDGANGDRAECNTAELNRLMYATLAEHGVSELYCHLDDPIIEYFMLPEHGGFMAEYDSVSVSDNFVYLLWLQALANAPTNKRLAAEGIRMLLDIAIHG